MSEDAADILVVDDSPSKRYVITSWLRRDGHRVVEAATGTEALALLHGGPDGVAPGTELVVLDVRLPDIDGFEVAERIKEDPRTTAVPVIHISATAVHAVDRTQGLNRGADAYLAEPIDPDELLATVRAKLREYRARRRAERLAGRLTRLVDTTTAFNATTSLPDLLLAAATGAARVFDGPAAVAASSEETGPIAVQVDAVAGEPQVRAAMREAYDYDPLDGQAGTVLFRQETGPWWPGAVWRLVARAKPGREPLHVAVPADGFLDDDADLLRQFGQAVALAVEALRSYDEERRTAIMLQQSMLPQRLPTVPGVQLAVRYRPASEHASVGGDFYEIMVVDGQLVAAIGDVAGHSLRAATIMAEVRHALRAYLVEDASPGPSMERLNRMMLRLLPEEIATMCLLSMDPASGRVRLTNAGHPPPLRVLDGQVTQVLGRVALLGVPTPHDTETPLTLAPGETLVMVTDGLIESRGHTFNEGLEALCVAVADAEADLEQFCDRLLADLGAGSRDDDVALLVIRRVDFP
ncbi:fused response regulator/phosphatase [Dactylosporangium aurantiacum]|uniref:Fused response regulator/phosphatase n=1 Tax=Dactylosporangium aurantiacum TaxID=35754 RepID=A0A9Q9MD44_9ACTN|nr:fused response regulator/phosphatase [Dactylosporangium aurantiacum]MDG6105146.1 fused response regulator/phosphatase [Dactylosporangium aurantiacum]UWZ51669.1 fused response regulator/phosphatase [Dactylosporangium aurantiacum]